MNTFFTEIPKTEYYIMKSLKGKTALITGASKGLGVYIAEALARQGMNLVLVARSSGLLDELAKKLTTDQNKIITITADVGDLDQLPSIVEQAESNSNGIDVLVNNAGVDFPYPYDALQIEKIKWEMDINLMAPMILTRLILPKMIERGRGHVVNISSLAGLVGTPYDDVYSTSKHGLMGFTRSLRLTAIGESYPVGFSVICPGYVSKAGMYHDSVKETGIESHHSVGITTPEKVAKSVIKAILKNKSEIILNSRPFRPILVIQALFPSLASWMTKKTGTISNYKKYIDTFRKSNH
jgi:short-subunit dehydrogenase